MRLDNTQLTAFFGETFAAYAIKLFQEAPEAVVTIQMVDETNCQIEAVAPNPLSDELYDIIHNSVSTSGIHGDVEQHIHKTGKLVVRQCKGDIDHYVLLT